MNSKLQLTVALIALLIGTPSFAGPEQPSDEVAPLLPVTISFGAAGKGDNLPPNVIEINANEVKVTTFEFETLKSSAVYATDNTQFMFLLNRLGKHRLSGQKHYGNCGVRDGSYVQISSTAGKIGFQNAFDSDGSVWQQPSFCRPYPPGLEDYKLLIKYSTHLVREEIRKWRPY